MHYDKEVVLKAGFSLNASSYEIIEFYVKIGHVIISI